MFLNPFVSIRQMSIAAYRIVIIGNENFYNLAERGIK